MADKEPKKERYSIRRPIVADPEPAHLLTDQELINGDANGTLTDPQKVEYLIRIEQCHPAIAHSIVYTDWDQVERNARTGEGPIP